MNEINFNESPLSIASQPISLTPEHQRIEQILQDLGIDCDEDEEQGVQNAIQRLDQAIAQNPSYPGYYILKGKILFFSKDLPNAIENLSKVIQIESHFSDPYFPLGEAQYLRAMALIYQHQFEDAYADLKSAIDLGHEEANEVFESLFSEDDKWTFSSTQVLKQTPNLLNEAQTSRSDLFSKALGLWTQSEQLVEEGALWTNPDIIQKSQEAILYLKEAIRQDPNNPSFYTLLGKLYMNIFERDLAIESLSKAIEIDPHFSDSNFPQGEALFQKGMANFNNFNKMLAQENFKAAIEQFNHEQAKTWLELTDYLK
jgi:tetratricopeptide (TPR) repeat protein